MDMKKRTAVKTVRLFIRLYNRLLFLVLGIFLFAAVEDQVCNDSEDKSACDRSQGNILVVADSECERKISYACDKNDGSREEVFVFAKIDRLKHLETGYRDESVKCKANTAHYA